MTEYRGTPIERFGKWWGGKDGAEHRREVIFGIVGVGGFIAFGIWLAATPEGQAFNNWVLQ